MARLSFLYEAYLRRVPRQSRSRGLVEAILGAASERLDRDGDDEAVTVQGVADRAGVGIASLYDYFGDRSSLLAAIAAKVTEDNRHAFEALLADSARLTIEEGVGVVVDFCSNHLTASKRRSRAVLKIAHAMGLMPTVAASTDVAAHALARALNQRTDIRVDDVDLAAWTITHAMVGVFHTLLWKSEEPDREALRSELVKLFAGYLRGEAAHPASRKETALG